MNVHLESAEDWNVEVSDETADRAEELLREFATDAELHLALVVDGGGGLVAGVATRPDVQVDTVGALVAGAFGAMRVLAGELGESDLVESVHHGGRDVIYLRDIDGQFILLGLTERALPAGLIREKAAQISTRLADLLAGSVKSFGGEKNEKQEPAEPPAEEPPAEKAPSKKAPEKTQQTAPAPEAEKEQGASGDTSAVFELSPEEPGKAEVGESVPKATVPESQAPPEAPAEEDQSSLKETLETKPKDQPLPQPQGAEEGADEGKKKGGKYVFEIR